jgi:hypothetical protein
MQIDLRNVRTRWINVDKDEEKARQMNELLDGLGFTNHERFSAVTGIAPHEGVNRGEEHYRNCAESHFKILEETILADGEPVLILEDDVEVDTGAYVPTPHIMEDTDAIYFGTSHGDGNYEAINQLNGWSKICRVFSTHAILHMNPAFSQGVIDEGKNHIYNLNRPFDVAIAYGVQHKFNVYAPMIPFFYQADAKNTVNKWERITRAPLNTKKKFSTRTIG